jgi:hypothetical protein
MRQTDLSTHLLINKELPPSFPFPSPLFPVFVTLDAECFEAAKFDEMQVGSADRVRERTYGPPRLSRAVQRNAHPCFLRKADSHWKELKIWEFRSSFHGSWSFNVERSGNLLVKTSTLCKGTHKSASSVRADSQFKKSGHCFWSSVLSGGVASVWK